MSWAEVYKLNKNFTKYSLDIVALINTYKAVGDDSFIGKNEKIRNQIYECVELSMNDDILRQDTFDYHVNINKDIGKVLKVIEGLRYYSNIIEILNNFKTLAYITSQNMTNINLLRRHDVVNKLFENNAKIKDAISKV
jgi:hypothetical protein|nr:MAG TPA: hypothetical protein [Caudoviricetes sp.]